MSDEKTEPKVDSTLSKGLSILENLSAAPAGKGVTKLSKELGLTKSNTFRLLQTLTALGTSHTLPTSPIQSHLKHGKSVAVRSKISICVK